jgi:hypothetical protein
LPFSTSTCCSPRTPGSSWLCSCPSPPESTWVRCWRKVCVRSVSQAYASRLRFAAPVRGL